MKKINVTKSFFKKLNKLEKQNIYSLFGFKKDVEMFLQNELNPKFKKHKLNGYKQEIYSIKLGYDLRAVYFLVDKKEEGLIEYLFFDIGDHDDVY